MRLFRLLPLREPQLDLKDVWIQRHATQPDGLDPIEEIRSICLEFDAHEVNGDDDQEGERCTTKESRGPSHVYLACMDNDHDIMETTYNERESQKHVVPNREVIHSAYAKACKRQDVDIHGALEYNDLRTAPSSYFEQVPIEFEEIKRGHRKVPNIVPVAGGVMMYSDTEAPILLSLHAG